MRYGIVPVLREVSLEVEAGEFVCLLGPNAAGKTTTVKTIAGLLSALQGKVAFDGADITGWPPHRIVECGIALVPEGRLLFPSMSVQENLELGSSSRRARQHMRRSLELCFSLFPVLKERHRQAAGTLSGGEQQMLAIGRALMAVPRLVILDEPSLGLAPKLTVSLFQTLKSLNEEGMSILLVEQNVVQALKYSHRTYVLETGQIVLQGASSELAHNELVRKSYLGL